MLTICKYILGGTIFLKILEISPRFFLLVILISTTAIGQAYRNITSHDQSADVPVVEVSQDRATGRP